MKYSKQNNMNDTLKNGSDFTEKFGKSTKKPIFELLRTKNKLMKGFSLYFKSWAIVISTLFLGVNSLNAQCTITWNGSLCVGSAITFTGSASGTTHDWTFEDASGAKNTSTGQKACR